jgi:hypothetical protein
MRIFTFWLFRYDLYKVKITLFSSVSFGKCVHSCNHHGNEDPYLQHSPKFSMPFLPHMVPDNTALDSVPILLPFLEYHVHDDHTLCCHLSLVTLT